MQSDLSIDPMTLGFGSKALRGGSSYRRMTSTNNAIDDASYPKDWIIFTISVGAWFIVALTLKLCCMKLFDYKNDRRSERDFDKAILEADAKTQRSQQKQQPTSSIDVTQTVEAKFEFYDSDFLLTYTDENTKALSTGFARLTMKNNGSGYTISGMCADESSAQIRDGFVAYSGEAWWVAHSEEDGGVRILSTGEFNFGTNRFRGTWRDNRGNHGRYLRFESTRAFISSSKEPLVTTTALTSKENIRRGSSMFLANLKQSLSVVDEERPPSD